VTLTIYDTAGVELLAADDLTLYTATTLDGAVARFLSTITLDSGADDLLIGDSILLCGIGGDEVMRVKGYDTTNQVVELEEILDNAYADGDAVYGLFGDINVDTSDTDVFAAGKVVTLKWIPSGSGAPVVESAQIAKTILDISGLRAQFKDIYERAYDAYKEPNDKFNRMVKAAKLEIDAELNANGLQMDRIVDQSRIAPVIMAKMAHMWTYNGDEAKLDEREFLTTDYNAKLALLLKDPIWADHDQDLVEDEAEVTSHEHIFERGW